MFAYYVHDLDPLIFRLWDNVGPRWYGLAYVLAFVCSYLVYRQLAQRGYADLSVAKVGDFITGAALFGVIVGGRLGYVLLRVAPQNFVDQSRRQPGGGCTDWIIFRTLRQFYQRRALRSRRECVMGDAVPERADREYRRN